MPPANRSNFALTVVAAGQIKAAAPTGNKNAPWHQNGRSARWQPHRRRPPIHQANRRPLHCHHHRPKRQCRGIKARVESAGLRVWNIGHDGNRSQEEIALNLPGRDARIEAHKQHLKYVTYAHLGNGIWHTERETSRGAAPPVVTT